MQKKIKKKILENNLPPPAPTPQSTTPQSTTPQSAAPQSSAAPNTQTQQSSAGTAPPNPQPQTPVANQQQINKPTKKSVVQTKLSNNIKTILIDMDAASKGSPRTGLITGDTGIGKTTFVKTLGRLLGLPEMIVEVPQIVGEHLINIPFIIINTDGNQSTGTVKIDPSEGPKDPKYELTFGRSYMVALLAKMTKIPDKEWWDGLSADDKALINTMGLKERINQIRSKFNRILFLDEFLRTAPVYVRNVLRNLLKNSLGSDELPKGTYILYASNTSVNDIEGSLDKLSSHQRFRFINFSPPSKDEWLGFTLSQLTKENIEIKEDVEAAFNHALTDEHVSYNDAQAGIRTSPRRWTEIFIYLNQTYPFKDAYSASLVYQSIKRQFSQTSEKNSPVSKLFSDVLERMLKELCRKSNISEKDFVATVSSARSSDWQKILAQNVSVMAESAGLKKYVPVVLGLPGIGKSTLVAEFEKPPFNFRVIIVDAQSLSTDDVVGITIPEERSKKEIDTNFSEPPLFIQIKNSIRKADENYKEHLKDEETAGKIPSADAAWNSYNNQKYKYLIFFDEINRISNVNTFNALRRVILEKEFNPAYKLPSTSLLIGAMNPDDNATVPMTNHFKDAIEIVDASPNWKTYLEYLKNNWANYLLKHDSSEMAVKTAIDFIEKWPKTFSDSKSNKDGREFYFKIASSEVWVSPRDLSLMLEGMVSAFDFGVDQVLAISKNRKLSDNEEIEIIVKQVEDEPVGTLQGIFYAEEFGTNQQEVFTLIHDMLVEIVSKNFTKAIDSADLDGIMDGIISGEITDLSEDSDWFNYMNNYQSNTFTDEFRSYLRNKFVNPGEENAKEFVEAMIKIAQVIESTGLEKFEGDILDRLREAFSEHAEEIGDKINKSDMRIQKFLISSYKKLLLDKAYQ